jgi:choline dehydrogenase
LHHNPHIGANLNDHQGINYTYEMTVPTYNDTLRPWWGKLRAGVEWLMLGRGPLAKSINHAGGFFRTDPAEPRPDMQLYMQAFSTLLPKAGERPVLTPDPWSGLSLGLSNCRPTSRGHIRIRSADPTVHPAITANAFSTDHDVAQMLRAVKFLRHLAAQPALAAVIRRELRPGPEVVTDDDLILDFRRRSGTVYHPSCTTRMGADPATSVTDPRLRVHGVQGLRVIDAGSFPTLIAGNTNAPAIMLGWRGAGMVLEDAR